MKSAPTIFISKEGMATFWFFVAAGAVVWAAFYVYRTATTAGLRPQYIIMEGKGSDVRPFPLELAPERDNEIHTLQTRLLMDSLFNKAPDGLDAEERCKKLMTTTAWAMATRDVIDMQKDAFKEGRIHQKVEIESITFRKVPEEQATIASVKGQLLRTGIFEAKIFNEAWVVRATFKWVRNKSLRDCARYPIVCNSLTVREALQSSTLQKVETDEDGQAAPQAPLGEEASAATN